MPTVRTGPASGLVAQVVVLGVLAGTVGLGLAGWLAGVAWGVGTYVMLAHGLTRAGADRLGPADRVTLSRATLVGGVTALVADGFGRPVSVPTLVTLAAVALVLDAVDGWVARRTQTASRLGAQFDMEVDAFLILVLSVYSARTVGGWVLAIGAARYAFGLVGWLLPWMNAALPSRYWRKVVAATQGIALAITATGALPDAGAVAVLAGSLGLLVESFGRDVWWLSRHRPVRTDPLVDGRTSHGSAHRLTWTSIAPTTPTARVPTQPAALMPPWPRKAPNSKEPGRNVSHESVPMADKTLDRVADGTK